MVVDDEADMRMALANVLLRTGHQVLEAGDGPAALELLAREGADAVLLDIRLPGMDGLQILRRIRESHRELPVVMVTGYGSADSAMEAMQLGASHYLAKPFSNRELIEALERVLAARAAGGGAAGVLGRRLAEKVRGGVALLDPAPLAAPGAALPARRSGSGPGWGAVLAAAALAGSGLLGARLWRAGRNVTLQSSNPSAVVWKGGRLWTADWFAQTVTESRVRGGAVQPLRKVFLPQSHVTGLALTADRLYVADSERRSIQRRRLDEQLSVEAAAPSPGSRPSCLFWDGRYLWSCDSAAGRIYQHLPDDGLSVLASYPSPGKAPVALYKDENYLWSADAQTRLVYQHRLDERMSVLASHLLPELNRGPQPLSCFTWRGRELWLGRDGSPRLAVRRLAAFTRSRPSGEGRNR